jgi:hypothetical protein
MRHAIFRSGLKDDAEKEKENSQLVSPSATATIICRDGAEQDLYLCLGAR